MTTTKTDSPRHRRGRTAVAIAALVTLAAGCTGGGDVDEKAPASIPDLDGLHVSYAAGHFHTTLADLSDGAELIVVVTPTGTIDTVTVEQPDSDDADVPATIVEYEVVRGHGSVAAGDTVWVAEPFLTQPELLPRTDSYALMFLSEYRYWLGESRPADLPAVYMTRGVLQGLWVDTVGDGLEFTRTTTDVADLPATVTFDDAVSAGN